MNNTIIATLLNDNRHFFQALHACFGMDFLKPYIMFEITGKFTINQLLKIAGPDHTPEKDLFIIATRAKNGFCNRYSVAALDKYGKIDIDFKSNGYNNNCFVSLDKFYTKKDFDSVRKLAAHTVVIYQNRDFLNIPGRKNIDNSERFKLIKVNECFNAFLKFRYISKLELKFNNTFFMIEKYPDDTDKYNKYIDNAMEIIETNIEKAAYYDAIIQQQGGIIDRKSLKKGMIVNVEKWGNVRYLRGGSKNITFEFLEKHMVYADGTPLQGQVSYAEIKEIVK